jgi:hypothetical protein
MHRNDSPVPPHAVGYGDSLKVTRDVVRLNSGAIFAVGVGILVFVQVAAAAPANDACDLPQDLQHEVAVKYPGAKLVGLSDLGEDDRGFFQKDHGDACPGMVKADFYGDGRPTVALVLIRKSGAKKKAELVLGHQVAGGWRTTMLDTSDGAPVPVIWSQPPDEYRDVYGNKKIRATRPVIVFAAYESWAIVYAWTGKDIAKVWIAD